jgi:hypothetical protein
MGKMVHKSDFSVTARISCHFSTAARTGRVPFKEVFRGLKNNSL